MSEHPYLVSFICDGQPQTSRRAMPAKAPVQMDWSFCMSSDGEPHTSRQRAWHEWTCRVFALQAHGALSEQTGLKHITPQRPTSVLNAPAAFGLKQRGLAKACAFRNVVMSSSSTAGFAQVLPRRNN